MNDPYYLNLFINLALLAVGMAAGYFTAIRIGQKDAIELKNELIKALTQKVALLEKEVEKVKKESKEEIDRLNGKNDKLQSTLDDLVALEEARKRVSQKNHRASSATPPKKEEQA